MGISGVVTIDTALTFYEIAVTEGLGEAVIMGQTRTEQTIVGR
jgi:hypothetical protein